MSYGPHSTEADGASVSTLELCEAGAPVLSWTRGSNHGQGHTAFVCHDCRCGDYGARDHSAVACWGGGEEPGNCGTRRPDISLFQCRRDALYRSRLRAVDPGG